MAPAGKFAPCPMLAGREVALAGILYTTQCHQPLPVGASGSYTVRVKLLVPLGAFFQDRAGDRFSPVQPKPLKTCLCATLWPGLKSLLLKVKGAWGDLANAAPPYALLSAKAEAKIIFS